MRSNTVRCFVVLAVILALPLAARAQEASIGGTVTDSTAAVLPGVIVTVVHEASGNSFEGVTDARGVFRIPVRIGVYRLTATLPGFATLTRTGLELLVGQQATVAIEMVPEALQESVTVTAEAPLLDVATSSLGGNIDSRQASELPLNGRNWLDLALLAPGNRTMAVGDQPVQDRDDVREYQINLDGQQITHNTGVGGNPKLSRDMIAEFEFLSNRFDATQGRSSGVQVNAITKSGTNVFTGTLSGYFRDDRFNAPDFVTGKVDPYSNQQISSTFGGPILRDRLHFFGNVEYERSPRTAIFTTPYPRFNITLQGTDTVRMGGFRTDYQLSPQTRFLARMGISGQYTPYDTAGGTNHPASTRDYYLRTDEYLIGMTRVFGNRALNDLKAGYSGFHFKRNDYVEWAEHPQAAVWGIRRGFPRITFRGFAITGNVSSPQETSQNQYMLRDDFTVSFSKGGRHDVKIGGEYLYMLQQSGNCRQCMGIIDAQNGNIPANIEDLFPVWNNASTWNLAAISPNVRTYNQGVGKFRTYFERHTYAAWIQDDWAITGRLTLNLGIRYDLIWDPWANEVEILPLLEAGRPNHTKNIGPRLGFAYRLMDRTVFRGGYGLYYGDTFTNPLSQAYGFLNIAAIQLSNDGRPDFAANPFNGPIPTYAQAIAGFCSTRNVPGCFRRTATELPPYPAVANWPKSHQSSIGFQRQLTDSMAFEADYAYIGSRNEKTIQTNINLTYDPITGANYPFADISRRALPEWGAIGMTPMTGWSNYHGLQTAVIKRMSQRWQGTLTYTLSGLWNGDPPPLSGLLPVAFAVAPDLGGEYTLAETDQRHRLVFNGILQAGFGFQLSGLYIYGSGQRFDTTYGGDLRNSGRTGGRLRPDGTIVPRNEFIGDPTHRVDVRVQRRFTFSNRVAIDGMVEVFNLFNYRNYGSYTTQQSNAAYGQPTRSTNLAFQSRRLQFGFRTTF